MFEIVCKRIEASLPKASICGNPRIRISHRRRFERQNVIPSPPAPLEESCTLENTQVLRHCGPGNPQWPCQFSRCSFAAAKTLENHPTRRIRKRGKSRAQVAGSRFNRHGNRLAISPHYLTLRLSIATAKLTRDFVALLRSHYASGRFGGSLGCGRTYLLGRRDSPRPLGAMDWHSAIRARCDNTTHCPPRCAIQTSLPGTSSISRSMKGHTPHASRRLKRPRCESRDRDGRELLCKEVETLTTNRKPRRRRSARSNP